MLKAESKRDKEKNKVTEDTIDFNYTLDYLFDTHWFARLNSVYREEGVDITSQYWYLGAGPGYRLWGEGKDKPDAISSYNRFWFSTGQIDFELSAWGAHWITSNIGLTKNCKLFQIFRLPTLPLMQLITSPTPVVV